MDEADLIPISALQHTLYCPRQCALIHVEQVWAENRFTAEGRILHEKSDQPGREKRRGLRTITAMPLRSWVLGVSGIADVVELHDVQGKPMPFPIEYKRGRRKRWDNDEVQLCAQAICLEEMLGVTVPAGAVYSVKSRRRREVAFSASLRQRTADAAGRLHHLLTTSTAPPPVLLPKCGGCSVREICMPDLVSAENRYHRAAAELFVRPRDEK